MPPLAVPRIDARTIIKESKDRKVRKFWRGLKRNAQKRVVEHLFPRIAQKAGGAYRFIDQSPSLVHVTDPDFVPRAHAVMKAYRETLPADRRVLLDRYRLVDYALKVVGIGSVGTRCYIALLMSAHHEPLILQFKEAGRSVLEPYTRQSPFDNQSECVVVGQRLMQSSSGIFLGWATGRDGNDFYVRQLRYMKMSVPIEGIGSSRLQRLAAATGRVLARAHAKSTDTEALGAYLGRSDSFDRAMAIFAVTYADQTEKDHAALAKAVKAGRIKIEAGK